MVIEGQVAGQGQGGSKKQAEQEAARIALEGQK
ncbi:MAG: putative dsRNA-binding protein [Bacteroidota bacterium]